ncbi:MAG: hypothetical protein RL417_609 [Pseudomonadota bacterium]|jgi:hypothetical protein
MRSLIAYYLDRFRFAGAADFISMGLGIEARYRRCRSAWEPHLRLTREFIERALSETPKGSKVAVLGAGRLLDVPVERLQDLDGELHLFDADPGCRWSWRRLSHGRTRVIPHILDLTGSIERWTTTLKDKVGSVGAAPEEITKILDSLTAGGSPELKGFDAIISVNLLSQIPIYWRDRVESLLGPEFTAHPGAAAALERSYNRLQGAHRDILCASKAPCVVVITDEKFFYYRSDIAPWQEERSLYVDAHQLPGYSITREDSWYWHIIPQGIEERDFGSIHAVRAIEFEREGGGAAYGAAS